MGVGVLEKAANSQENTCVGVWYKCFPVNFAKFLRTSLFKEDIQWPLLTGVLQNSCLERFL